MRWNIESGERTKILDLPKNGLVTGLNILMALGGEGDQPVLCLADLVKTRDHGINPTADSVSEAANLNRDFLYQYEDDSAEEARTRVLADLSGGNGPDLMYVSLED